MQDMNLTIPTTRVLDSQAGRTFLSNPLLAYMPHACGIDMAVISSEVENFVALYFALREAQSATQAASILLLFIKNYTTGSVSLQIIQYIREICDFDVLNPQSSEEEPEWLKNLKDLRTNWHTASNNKAFKKVSDLLSMSAALGLCDLANLQFDINGIRIFSIAAYKKHITAPDLFGAAFDTFVFFVEGGWKCICQGSLKPFTFSGDEAAEFEQAYFEMLDLAPFMKAGNLLTKKNVTENDFDFRLNKLIDQADTLYQMSEGTWEKKVLFDRLSQLRKIRAEFISVRVDGKLRQAPFATYIEGPSGVGKSSVSAILMRIVLMSNGFDASDERLITLNEADKYMSTYRSHINGIFIDDLGNTMPQYVEKSPVEKVIEMVNNVPAYANMAEADLKGKVSIEPHCLVGTSNVQLHSLAKQYSNEPYSIVRRFPLQLYVTVKDDVKMEDGRLDSSKVHDKYPDGIPAIPDLWNIEVFFPYEDHANLNRRSQGKMDIYQVIKLAKKMSLQHFTNQKEVVEFASNLDDRLRECDWEHPELKKTKLPEGTAHDLDDAFGPNAVLDNQSLNDVSVRIQELIRQAQNYNSRWLCWTNYIPDYLFDNRFVDLALSYMHRRRIFADTRSSRSAYIGSTIIGFISLLWSMYTAFGLFLVSTYLYIRALVIRKREIIRELRDLNGAMPLIFRRIRDNHVNKIAAAGTLLGVLFVMLKAYKSARTLDTQGNLNPKSAEDIAERDAEVSPWAGLEVTVPHVADNAHGITSDQLKQNIFNNLCYMVIEDSISRRYCDAFFVKSNVAIIPNHIMKGDEAIGKFFRRGGETNGAYFSANLSRRFSVLIPNTDLLLVWIPNSCSMRDLSKYMAVDNYSRRVDATLIWKSQEGERTEMRAMLNPGVVRTAACNFDGFNYTLPEETFNGLCMAVWVSESVTKQILGFHLGGKGKLGGAGKITLKMFEMAEARLKNIEGVLLAKNQGTVMLNQYGVNFYEGSQVHDKSPTRFLPKGNNVEVFGSVIGRVRAVSQVTPTVISDTVEEVCGVKQQWGPPKFNNPSWRPWQESLQYSSVPSVGMEGTLLQKAVQDYKLPLMNKLLANEHLREDIKPLTEMQTVCGIDGKRFIDKMKPNTSVGFPLSGPKSAYLTELDPEHFEEFSCPRELDPMFWEGFKVMKEKYIRGERAYPVFKAALKDEPTSLDKDKVRVFQAAPIELQLGVRMYFLPVARYLSLYPLLSECAVGINAQGPEWDVLARHIMKYGDKRILAGDYSKYDLRMSSQLMYSAFRIMIDLARATGNYTAEDISIMEGLATDICQPLMAYNGDYIQHIGSNPSGQNLTVYINSIVNSLLFRCAYFEICKHRTLPPFRQVCSLATYGDDAKSSVAEGWDEFNHISVAKFLADRDMKFTMPDKTSTPTEYMTDEAADFLKRKNVFNEEVGLYFGALDDGSIFKSLHSVLRSKAVSNEEQCMGNIDGALREWFAHGRETYEMRRKQMIEIAERTNLRHGCSELDMTYDMALARFCQKYDVTLESQADEYVYSRDSFWCRFCGKNGDNCKCCEPTVVVLEPQCGEEIPYDNEQHCLGDSYSIHFWWETVAANCSLIIYPIVWYLLRTQRYEFKVGMIRKEWLYFLVFTTGGFSRLSAWLGLVSQTLIFTYVFEFGVLYYNTIMSLVQPRKVNSKGPSFILIKERLQK